MQQPLSEHKPNLQEEKEPYTKPELVTHEPLRDLTMNDSGGMTQIDPPSLQID